MAMYLTNGTLNYNLTKEYILTPEQIAERNNMIPDYPDPNDERFKETLPVFTLENNQLCRDGVSIGKVYNNKTGKVVEITETTETGFKYQDTEEDALINKDNSIAAVEKLTGLKSEITFETRVVAVFNVTSTSSPTMLCYYTDEFAEMEIDGIVQPNVISSYTFSTTGEHTVKYTLVDPTTIGCYFDGYDYLSYFDGTPISEITIPNSVTSIDRNAFAYCSNLTSVTIPNGVTSIGDEAFGYCSNLTSVTIPNGVTSIGESAFQNCSSLTSVTIGSGVTSIGKAAFQGCRALTSITIPNSVTSIGMTAFNSCTGLTSVTIPDSVTSIGNSAFGGCSGLTSLIIGSGVTSIDIGGFVGCSGLTSVTIPNSVTSIDDYVFQSCSNLTSITIGSGVTSIGQNAFWNCVSLTSITSLATTAPTIRSNIFQNVKTNGTLYVPQDSTGYDTWMGTGQYYLGYYNWTKIEQ